MDQLEFVRLANTMPINFNGHRADLEQFLHVLCEVSKSLAKLDDIKRELLCENKYNCPVMVYFHNTCSELPATFKNYEDGIQVISAILNIASKTKDLINALQVQFKQGEETSYSWLKYYSSISDIFQYQAMMADYLGRSFEEMQIDNVEKNNIKKHNKYIIETTPIIKWENFVRNSFIKTGCKEIDDCLDSLNYFDPKKL